MVLCRFSFFVLAIAICEFSFASEPLIPESSSDIDSALVIETKFFSYNDDDEFGPINWDLLSDNCGGRRQSPINLISYFAVKVLSDPFIISGFDDVPDAVTATNNGHSVVVRWASSGTPATFSGGDLNGTFIIDNAHFHWGEDDEFGSEHQFNSRQYSMEVHITSFNSKYGTISNAATKPNGLAVLGFMFEVDFNAEKLPFIDDIHSIVHAGSSVNTTIFSIKDLIIYNHFEYYSYKGSLTIPDCYETVTWMVSTKILLVNPDDLAELRTIKNQNDRDLVQNFRPEQESNNRLVTFQSTM